MRRASRAKLVRHARAGPLDGRLGDRWRRMADGAGRHGALWRRVDVAGHAQHSRASDLQPRDQPLHALFRRADFHRQVSHAARPPVLAHRLFDSRFRFRISVSGRECRHAAGRGDPGQDPRRDRNLDHAAFLWPRDGADAGHADAGAGLWHLSGVAIAADIRRQDLQRAKGRDDVQDRHGVRLLDVPGDLLFDDVDLARDRNGLFPLRHRARARRRRRRR